MSTAQTENRLAALVEAFISACREIKKQEGEIPDPLVNVFIAAVEEMDRLGEPGREAAQRALNEEMRMYDLARGAGSKERT